MLLIDNKIFFEMMHFIVNFIKIKVLPAEKDARRSGVKIGKNCLSSTENFPSEAYLIEIGDYVRITRNVKFFTHAGLWSQRKKNHLLLEHFGKIKIGNYTYIGDGCLIMPGVTIGNDAIIGAGSVVVKSIPDGVMVAGKPIKIIGKTEEFIIKDSQNPSIESKAFYKLNDKERREYIKNIPDDRLIQKDYIK
jgi:acetyltransferase-like isoleucine patch superfamily enzyme